MHRQTKAEDRGAANKHCKRTPEANRTPDEADATSTRAHHPPAAPAVAVFILGDIPRIAEYEPVAARAETSVHRQSSRTGDCLPKLER
jgi:hypothetical protein